MLDDETEAAATIAHLIAAFHRVETSDAPQAAGQRRQPLTNFDETNRAAIASAEGLIDTILLTAIWEAALTAPPSHGPPVWIHGDLHPGNLLAHQRRLHAVIDYSATGLADPAAELSVVWSGVFLSSDAVDRFREELPIDEATWARGRGWGLLKTPMAPANLAEDVPAGCRPRLLGLIADYQRHA